MKYCFFDIECANCFKDNNGVSRGKICEFGYLITDENFNKIESAEYIINPKAPFDEYVLNNIFEYREEVGRGRLVATGNELVNNAKLLKAGAVNEDNKR